MPGTCIQTVDTCPDYINQFIQTNMEQLINIYDAGYEVNNKEGCLGLICNQETNKMDVMFLSRHNITQFISIENWEDMKRSIPNDKKLFYIRDEGLDAVFLLYI